MFANIRFVPGDSTQCGWEYLDQMGFFYNDGQVGCISVFTSDGTRIYKNRF